LNTISIESTSEQSEACRQVEAYCQSLVNIGAAQWRVNDAGASELHMENGEAYQFGEWGVMRLK
jgi:hypothetical protein